MTLLENDDTEVPVDVALVEEDIKDVNDMLVTALDVLDTTWDFEIIDEADAEGSAVVIPVIDAHDDTLFETNELRDCKALTDTAALSESTTTDGKDDVLRVAIAVLEANEEEVEDFVDMDEKLSCTDIDVIGDSELRVEVVGLSVSCKDRVDREEGSADFEEAVDTLESIDGADEEDAGGA